MQALDNLHETGMVTYDWLLVKVLRPTRHKIGHFRDVSQANLLACYEKQNLTQQKHTYTNQKKCTTTQNTQKLKPGLVTCCDIRPKNGVGLFWFQSFINLSLTYLFRHLLT